MKTSSELYPATRGFRNLNPCNIRRTADAWRGLRREQLDSSFCQFEGMEYGFRAFFVLMTTYIYSHKLLTIDEIVNRYAPPSENATSSYCKRVHDLLGSYDCKVVPCPATDSATFWCKFALAVASVENGCNAFGLPRVVEAVLEGWKLFARSSGITCRSLPLAAEITSFP